MSNIKRRIEKIEDKLQSVEKESNDRKARLLEMQNRGEGNTMLSLLLQLEQKYKRRLTLVDLVVMAHMDDH
jgi:hypothetical protein